jgi:hypothetical protein
MINKTSYVLAVFSTEDKYKSIKDGFWKLGDKCGDNKIIISPLPYSEYDEFGNSTGNLIYSDVYELTLLESLMEQFKSKKEDYRNEINNVFHDLEHKPKELHNLAEILIEDIEEIKEVYETATYLDEVVGIKDYLIRELDELLVKLQGIAPFNLNVDLEKDKIKFNLNKKEVCLLFSYLFKYDIITGLNSNEELAEVIEKHCMHKFKGEFNLITNAKNTISKNSNDELHKSFSPKLQKILKEYKKFNK